MNKMDFYKELRENGMKIINGEVITNDGFYVGKEEDLYERFMGKVA